MKLLCKCVVMLVLGLTISVGVVANGVLTTWITVDKTGYALGDKIHITFYVSKDAEIQLYDYSPREVESKTLWTGSVRAGTYSMTGVVVEPVGLEELVLLAVASDGTSNSTSAHVMFEVRHDELDLDWLLELPYDDWKICDGDLPDVFCTLVNLCAAQLGLSDEREDLATILWQDLFYYHPLPEGEEHKRTLHTCAEKIPTELLMSLETEAFFPYALWHLRREVEEHFSLRIARDLLGRMIALDILNEFECPSSNNYYALDTIRSLIDEVEVTPDQWLAALAKINESLQSDYEQESPECPRYEIADVSRVPTGVEDREVFVFDVGNIHSARHIYLTLSKEFAPPGYEWGVEQISLSRAIMVQGAVGEEEKVFEFGFGVGNTPFADYWLTHADNQGYTVFKKPVAYFRYGIPYNMITPEE